MAEQKHVDPTALGLFGLAVVTLVASSQKLGITDGLSYVIPWAVFLGALAQLVAGIWDFKKCNAFGGAAFCSYGFFWLAMATSWLINMGAFGEILQSAVDTSQMAFAFIAYLIITIFFTIGATTTNKVLFCIFFFIDTLFIGLAISTFIHEGAAHTFFHYFAAVSELLIALFSFYGAGANIVNTQVGRTVFPIGKAFGPFVKAK
ncbi:acetate uptake transporter [Ruminococcaceae bacterium OttesenSCG-928-I18]|nr:acetate uptake transporter [Ruminococcaceae bacterium OttesenSCG-928-I18]